MNDLIHQLQKRIPNCLQKDQFFLARDLEKLAERLGKNQPSDKFQQKLDARISDSEALVQRRQERLPAIEYPEQLPIAGKREQIAKAIAENQVVILAGETGSGKTTQIPKICLELGRGVSGMVGHTQPRRIAARTVASRIAEELKTELGDLVGYQVRFNDHSHAETLVKLMTDGILLAEIQNDRYLNKYDTLIIDEAHERSLNIDFLLGYLKQILPKRPDLKVIITSATIDLERFANHFTDEKGKPAPIIEVSGRTYPVEVLYRPTMDEEGDLNDAVINAVEEILELEKDALSHQRGGDVLVFMSGEREIREAAHAIRKAQFPHFETLPLYARLSLAEQNKVFHGHKGRRIILATNVAETSITVPGIRYVIDPGTARISRYSVRTKVQRLPIEAVSQASANQRKGRCGRVAEGVCIRLYDEEDFNNRPEFTEAEILRTNLASVILQMLQLGMGDIRHFPFVDRPDKKLINDGYKLLQELQAVNSKGHITKNGRKLARLPVDPRLGRVVLEAVNKSCLHEILRIISALSVQDPRERPAEKQQAADEKHRAYRDDHSDFIAYVNLWNIVEEQRQELSQSQFRKFCQRNFLSYMRLREWRDIHHQLRLALKDIVDKNHSQKLAENKEPASYESVHRALLTGFLGNVGNQEEQKEFIGARNKRFMVFPGSSQYKKPPKWLMAGELIETSKLFAHTIAKVDPEWILQAAEHLVKRSHSEPHYDVKTGQVMAFEKITLYGLTLIEKRRVSYGKINTAVSNEVFIREALVEGKYLQQKRGKHQTLAKFAKHNQQLINEIEDYEAKARKRDLLVDDEMIFQFFKERVPGTIVNLAGFEKWRKDTEQDKPTLLYLTKEVLMQRDTAHLGEAQFPNEISWDGLILPLSYCFEPGKENDGVTVSIPLAVLHQTPQFLSEWLVPGLLREKCIALVKSLPKATRRHFVPVPDFVDKALLAMKPCNQPLTSQLGEQLKRLTSVTIPTDQWLQAPLDSYYQMNFQLVDENGKTITMNRDLDELKATYRDKVQASMQSSQGQSHEQENITQWDFPELPETVQYKQSGVQVRAYPALTDEGESSAIRLHDNPKEALAISWRGVCRLTLLELGQTAKYLRKELLKGKDVGLSVANMGNRQEVVEDLLMAAVRDTFYEGRFGTDDLPRAHGDFEKLLSEGREKLVATAQDMEKKLLSALKGMVEVKAALKGQKNNIAIALAAGDIQQQLQQLFYKGCLFETPGHWLQQYERYLKAIQQRIEKAALNPQRDRVCMADMAESIERWNQWLQGHSDYWRQLYPEAEEYRWMLEELRVSLYAQTLKTLMPVSTKRLNKQWLAVENACAK
ncbi:MAG: ATP-dependent RNA helicase HrpA [Cellvibrionaceae bacterium]